MIAISDDVLWKRFNLGLKRGNVLRTLIHLQAEQRYKRLLLLNIDFNDEEVFYFFTTSRVKWYFENKNWEVVSENCVFVETEETSNNITEKMVIDCRRVFMINKNDLFDNYKNLKLDFLEMFSEEIMSNINRIIKNSKLIAPKYITKII